VWKENAIKKTLDMYGSPYLTIGYLISWYGEDQRCGPMPKSWAEVKALVVGSNIELAWHVQGWCIVALINVGQVVQ
jgi:hypothetical protein